jgi:hypothetical protein
MGGVLTLLTLSQAPVVSRRVAPVVCAAATEEAAPVVEVTGPKTGVAKQTFQRGSVHKVWPIGGLGHVAGSGGRFIPMAQRHSRGRRQCAAGTSMQLNGTQDNACSAGRLGPAQPQRAAVGD